MLECIFEEHNTAFFWTFLIESERYFPEDKPFT